MYPVSCNRRQGRIAAAIFVIAFSALFSLCQLAGAAEPWVRLSEHPSAVALRSFATGHLAPETPVSLAITLPLRNQDELQSLLARLYDPNDNLYGHYLSPAEFTSEFAPTQSQYDTVAAFARSEGLSVTPQANRLVMDVSGPAGAIESAFLVHLNTFQSPEGRAFFAADNAPALPVSIASLISSVQGLDGAIALDPNVAVAAPDGAFSPNAARANSIGHGVSGGLTPADIKAAYSSAPVTLDGTGQSIALFELDDFTAHEVSTYESHYFPGDKKLAPISRITVDGGPGAPSGGPGEFEVALDIDLNLALAPHAAHIYVYEAPNSLAGIVDEYNKIATDDKASVVSTSWGIWEDEFGDSTSVQDIENTIFQEMAAQGQSVFAATGDYGAYDPHSGNISPEDPATQPWVCAVGGTTLSLKSNGTYSGETCWWSGPTGSQYSYGQGTGGGVSGHWQTPQYQSSYYANYFNNIGQHLASPAYADMASLQNRNIPDVSLDADPATGYDCYTDALRYGWISAGGTSAAVQVWGAFAALINQGRAHSLSAPVGFMNPLLYSTASDAATADALHDVTWGLDGNGYWSTGIGYDNTTGLGSFNMTTLLAQIAGQPAGVAGPPPPSHLSAAAGDTSATVSCSAVTGATQYDWYVIPSQNAGGTTAALSTAVTTKPTVTITGLTNGVTYQFAVIAVSSSGQSVMSTDSNAIAPNAVVFVHGPTVGRLGFLGDAATWTTNYAANSTISYGTTPKLGTTIRRTALSTSHSITLPVLKRGTRYYYQIQSSDGITTATATGTFMP